MIVPPFYFSFGDGEMYSFYSRMAEEIHGPVYIYNFPDRTGYTISPSVVRRLAKHMTISSVSRIPSPAWITRGN